MYLYCAFQSREEFSALDTSCMAISFFASEARSPPEALIDTADQGVANGMDEARAGVWAGVATERASTEATPMPQRTAGPILRFSLHAK